MVFGKDAVIYLLNDQTFKFLRVDVLGPAGTAAFLIQRSTDMVGELATLSMLAH